LQEVHYEATVPTVEDKIVQRAVTMLLGAIYEQDFHEFSHGFRAEHSAHQALSELREQCLGQRINWIVDADVSGFFDSLGHDRLQEMLQQRVKDGSILRLIGKWLHAGVVEGETVLQPETGSPQGAVSSPLLGKLFLHQVVDAWYVRIVKPRLRGRSCLIRCGDDVRHITWRQIPFTERRGAEETTSGSTTYLEAKAEGNNSMSLKRSTAEGVYGVAPQDPRDTVRATLPKPQFPAMEAYILCPQRLMAESSR
jgi:retron-type reverse transcriptase